MSRITVIVPYYKGKEFLADAVKSVQGQSLADWELIIVDDGSPDDGAPIAEALAREDRRIKVVRQQNAGASNARNTGARLADRRSRYLLFLDQDDLLEPNALQVMELYLDQNPGVGTAFFAASIIDRCGNVILDAATPFRCLPHAQGWQELRAGQRETPLVSLMATHHAVPSATLFRRCLFQRLGGWDESLRHAFEDQDIVWRAALLSAVHYVPIPVVRKRDHAHNVSKQPLLRGYRQLRHKWWRGAHLPPEQRSIVRHAMTRETLLTAGLNMHAARQSLACGMPLRGLRYTVRSVRKLALFCFRAVIMRGPRFIADALNP